MASQLPTSMSLLTSPTDFRGIPMSRLLAALYGDMNATPSTQYATPVPHSTSSSFRKGVDPRNRPRPRATTQTTTQTTQTAPAPTTATSSLVDPVSTRGLKGAALQNAYAQNRAAMRARRQQEAQDLEAIKATNRAKPMGAPSSVYAAPQMIAKFDPQTQRADGTAKGAGWLGPFRNKSGEEVTEYSVGVDIDGKEVQIPTLVPGMSRKEIDQVLMASESGEMPNEAIIRKAIAHARKMSSEGKSPFSLAPTNYVQKVQAAPFDEGPSFLYATPPALPRDQRSPQKKISDELAKLRGMSPSAGAPGTPMTPEEIARTRAELNQQSESMLGDMEARQAAQDLEAIYNRAAIYSKYGTDEERLAERNRLSAEQEVLNRNAARAQMAVNQIHSQQNAARRAEAMGQESIDVLNDPQRLGEAVSRAFSPEGVSALYRVVADPISELYRKAFPRGPIFVR